MFAGIYAVSEQMRHAVRDVEVAFERAITAQHAQLSAAGAAAQAVMLAELRVDEAVQPRRRNV